MNTYAVTLEEKRKGAVESAISKLKRKYGGASAEESLLMFLKEYFANEVARPAVIAGKVVFEAAKEAVERIAEMICNVLKAQCNTGVEVKVVPFEEASAATA